MAFGPRKTALLCKGFPLLLEKAVLESKPIIPLSEAQIFLRHDISIPISRDPFVRRRPPDVRPLGILLLNALPCSRPPAACQRVRPLVSAMRTGSLQNSSVSLAPVNAIKRAESNRDRSIGQSALALMEHRFCPPKPIVQFAAQFSSLPRCYSN